MYVALNLFGLEDAYSSDFRHGSDRTVKRVIVVFSHVAKPPLRTLAWPGDVLTIIDRGENYFTSEVEELATRVYAFVALNEYSEIALFGISKGGFGALLIGKILAERFQTEVSVFAFSPQTLLYPANDYHRFPSYKRMIERAKTDASLRSDLERNGAIGPLNQSSLRAFVAYGEDNIADTEEVRRIDGSSVTMFSVATSNHRAIMPFICDITDQTEVERTITRLRGVEDANLDDFIGPLELAKLKEELENYPANRLPPRLPALIETWFGKEPA